MQDKWQSRYWYAYAWASNRHLGLSHQRLSHFCIAYANACEGLAKRLDVKEFYEHWGGK